MNPVWIKRGLLFHSEMAPYHEKLRSHAANPLAVHLEDDIYRVYFSGRDELNRSSVGAVDINILTNEVVRTFSEPFFIHGPAGSFYADGVSIGNCYSVGDTTYMLFMGWQTPPDSHWRGDIGRLILNQDYSLELESEKPFMSTDAVDPVSLSYPWVLDLNGIYRMWYGSTVTWDAGNGEMLHVLNQASSLDGHSWKREGLAVPHIMDKAQAFSRPTVLENEDGSLAMWFSCRGASGNGYHIGYAESSDGKNWTLKENAAGITSSSSGWDSEMIEYPFVFRHKNNCYMLYNGNSHGASGFGLAVLSSD